MRQVDLGPSRVVGVAVSFAVPVLLAFTGGAYDIVARQRFGIGMLFGIALAFAFALIPRATPRGPFRWALLGAAALILLTALSLLWSESAERTTAELTRVIVYGGAIALVGYGVHSRSWHSIALALAFATGFVLLGSISSRLFPEAFETAGVFLLGGERLLYPIGYWNALAAWSAMSFALCLASSAHLRTPSLRALAAAVLPLAITVTYLTYSRGGTIALALAVTATLVLAPNRRAVALHAAVAASSAGLVVLVIRSHPEIAMGTGDTGADEVLGALFLAMAATALAAAHTKPVRFTGGDRHSHAPVRVTGLIVALAGAAALVVGFGVSSPSANGGAPSNYPALSTDPATRFASLDGNRDELWASALQAFGGNPVLGIGPGTYEFWWNREGEGTGAVRDAHSLYLETAAELGLPGLIALAGLLGGLLAYAIRGLHAARTAGTAGVAAGLLVAYLIFLFYATFDWVWETTAVAVLALACAATAGAASASPRPARMRGGLKWAVGGAAIAAAGGLLQIPGVVSAERIRASAAEIRLGDAVGAFDVADEAVAAQPWAASPYAQRAIAGLEGGDIASARADAMAAIEREESNWRHWLLLSAVLNRDGDKAAARRALRKATVLGPRGRVREGDVPREWFQGE